MFVESQGGIYVMASMNLNLESWKKLILMVKWIMYGFKSLSFYPLHRALSAISYIRTSKLVLTSV